ncbi:YSIRK-type signal peptide-containing protein, partial [uncultured Streptococcus sp.]|uniref:YSIRK-type signal peptide-containing protein n=1 Tax=uncultured Streptococcus sp. TaxID=83427 RepID=UPI0025E350E5
MKRFEKVQERIQKYSIRKLSVGVGSVAIAALIFGSSLSSSPVAADEVGGGATAHYTYVEEQELTEQEKGLIKKGLPENLQTGENYYLIYRKQDGQAVLPRTGNNGQPLLGLFAGTAILAVLVFSRKKSGKLLGVLLLGSLGQTVLQSPQTFALENRELLSYNRQVAVSSTVSEADVTIAGHNYIGYFTASDLRTLTENKPASLSAGQEARGQAELSEAAKEDSDSIDRAAQAGLLYQLNPAANDSGQSGKLPAPQPSNPTIETAKGESLQEPALPEYSGGVNGQSTVQTENPSYTISEGTAGDTAPVEPALPEYTRGVNGESLVQADNPVYDAPVATVSGTAPVEPALPEYTGGVNGESLVQVENSVYDAQVGTAGDTAPVEPALPEYTGGVNGESLVQADNPVYDAPVATV